MIQSQIDATNQPVSRSLFQRLISFSLLLTVVVLTGCGGKAIVEPDKSGYLLTFDQTKQLDYDTAWQSVVATTFTGRLEAVFPYDDLIVTIENGRNIVSAVSAVDGTRQWDIPVGDRLEHLHGVVRAGDQFIINSQSELYIVDSANGTIISRQDYGTNNVAMTAPFILDSLAIYGTPDGRIVYHHLGTGMQQSAYRFDSDVPHVPIWLMDAIAVVTETGQINVIDPGTNSRIWMNRVLDPVTARPVADSQALYVAGTDQSIWAFRLSDGKLQWRHRTDAQLTDDPKVIGDTLYQSVPKRGMMALDITTGKERWNKPAQITGGTVIAFKEYDLIVWHSLGRGGGSVFYRVDSRTGDVISRVVAPEIDLAAADRLNNGSIYGLNTKDGRLIRLDP